MKKIMLATIVFSLWCAHVGMAGANASPKETVIVDVASLKQKGVLKFAQELADSPVEITFAAVNESTSRPAISENAEECVRILGDSIYKEVGSRQCDRLERTEWEKTLAGVLKLVRALEAYGSFRAQLCAADLRIVCLKVLSDRLVGNGESVPAAGAILRQSLCGKECSQRYLALLKAEFPQWAQEFESLTLPLAYRDWYAIYRLGMTSDKQPWPDHRPIFLAAFGYDDRRSVTMTKPDVRFLVTSVLTNEDYRLQLVWLERVKDKMGAFPEGREEFIQAASTALEFHKEDIIPFFDKEMDVVMVWKSSRQARNRYRDRTQEAQEK